MLVDLADAKRMLRVSHDDEDILIDLPERTPEQSSKSSDRSAKTILQLPCRGRRKKPRNKKEPNMAIKKEVKPVKGAAKKCAVQAACKGGKAKKSK